MLLKLSSLLIRLLSSDCVERARASLLYSSGLLMHLQALELKKILCYALAIILLICLQSLELKKISCYVLLVIWSTDASSIIRT